jgi:hypothetical protein
MHRTAIHDELPVSAGFVHFLHERIHLRHRDVRIQSAVADQNFRLYGAGLGWPRRAQAPMNTSEYRVCSERLALLRGIYARRALGVVY